MTSHLDENKCSSKNAASESERLDIPMISWSVPIISSGEETPDNLEEDQAQHSPIIGNFNKRATPLPSQGKGPDVKEVNVKIADMASADVPPPSCGQSWDQMIDNVLEEDKRLGQVSVDLFSDVTDFDLDSALEESFVVPPNRNTRFDDSFQELTACEQSARNQGNISDKDIFVAPPNKVTRLDNNLSPMSGQEMPSMSPSMLLDNTPTSVGKVQHVMDACYVTGQLWSQKGIILPIGMGKVRGDISKMSTIGIYDHSSFQNNSFSTTKKLRQVRCVKLQKDKAKSEESKTSGFVIYSTSSVGEHASFQNNPLSTCQKAKKSFRANKPQKGKAQSMESKTPDFIIDSSYTTDDHIRFQNNPSSTSQRIRKSFRVNAPLKSKPQSKESNMSDFIIDSTYPLDDQISFQKNPTSKCRTVRKSFHGNKPQKGKAQREKSKNPDFVIDSSSNMDECSSFRNDPSSTCENLTKLKLFNKSQKGKGQSKESEMPANKTDFTCPNSLQNNPSSICEKLSKARLVNKSQKGKLSQSSSIRIYPTCPMGSQMVARSEENSSFNQKVQSNNSESRQTHESYWLRSQTQAEPLRRQTLMDVTSLNLPSRAEFIPDLDLPPGFWEDPDADWPQEWVDDLQRFEDSF